MLVGVHSLLPPTQYKVCGNLTDMDTYDQFLEVLNDAVLVVVAPAVAFNSSTNIAPLTPDVMELLNLDVVLAGVEKVPEAAF